MSERLLVCATTACNRECRHCTTMPMKLANPRYHAQPTDLLKLAHHTLAAGHRFPAAHITGGEPTLWRHLALGVGVLRSISDAVQVWTNGLAFSEPERAKELAVALKLATSVRVTEYPDSEGQSDVVAAALPGMSVSRRCVRTHRVNPMIRLAGLPPPECTCPGYYYFRGTVWVCGAAIHTIYRLGDDPWRHKGLYVPVGPDYLARLADAPRDGLKDVCAVCGSNTLVNKTLASEPVVDDMARKA